MTWFRNLSKKTGAVLIAMLIVLSSIVSVMVVVSANTMDIWDGTIASDYAGGTGTENDPYLISTPEQLALMAIGTNYVNAESKYYKLTADIYLNDITKTNWKENSPNEWLKAKTDSNYFFNGNLDGDGHTIYGIYVNGGFERAGLVPGVVGTVSFKNVVISDSYINGTDSGSNYYGGFVGYVYRDTTTVSFEKCYVSESVFIGGNNRVGGFVGFGANCAISFKNCGSFVTVNTTVASSKKFGSFIGGIDYSNANKKVTYDGCIGNIVFTNWQQYATVINSYCGEDGTVTNNATDKTYPTVVALEDMKGAAAKTNMPNLDWKVWKTTERFPMLAEKKIIWDGTIATEYAGGTGTAEDPYLIETPQQLALMAIGTDYGEKGANIVGKYYKLTADIYLNDTDNPNWTENNPNKWLTAKRDTKYSFTGHFDGDGHTIRGLYAEGSFARVGLFSSVYGNVSFKNIVIADSSLKVTGSSGADYVGAFVGMAYRAEATFTTFENCYVDDSVSLAGRTRVAGFVGGGAGLGASFKNCASFAEVIVENASLNRQGSFVGGMDEGERKITYDNCIGNIAYTQHQQFPTYINSYCAVEGTVDTNTENQTFPTVVALDDMKGAAAKEKMPNLNWNVWKTTDSFPEIDFVIKVWDGTIATGYAGGTGTEEDPYLIATPQQLALMAIGTVYNEGKDGGFKDQYFKLTADIYLNKTDNADWKENNPNVWITGKMDSKYFFTGNLDGDGHTIKGLYASGNFERMGLFPGVAGNVSVQNLTIADSYFCGTDTAGKYIGGFAGYIIRTTTTLKFESCYVADTVTIIGEHSLGGFAGYGACESIEFKNCASFASVTNRSEQYVRYGSFVGSLIDGARKIKYDGCVGNIAFTTYAQYPTYSSAYCAVEGTVDSNSKVYPTVVSLEDMKGAAAKTNMPDLDWNVFKTTNSYPIIQGMALYEICKINAHYNDDANTVKVIKAIVGTTAAIPSIEREGYYIEGWYTDAALTTKFDPANLTEGTIDIYAKWNSLSGSVLCDFENYPFASGQGYNSESFSIVEGVGVNNSKALRYLTTDKLTNWWNSRLAAIPVGSSHYTLDEGAVYKVTFKYFVPTSPDTPVNVFIWSANQEKITDTGSNALQQTMSNDLIITKDTPVGQWLTYTASFTAEIYDVLADTSTTNDKLKNVNGLALGFVTGDKISVGTTVYVDDFTVEKVKESDLATITVHTKGVSTTQVFKGVPGDMLVKAPTRKDFIFEGFYSDAALTNPVKEAKFPTSGNLDLYAKWKSFGVGDSITIGFDDYNYISGSKQFYPWYSMNNTDSADGDGVSVQATMGSSCSTTMRLAYKGYPVLIENGERYLVSFSYKNLDEIPNKWSTRVYANSPLNGGIGTTVQSSEDTLYRLTLSKAAGFGTWKRHTYSFTANVKYPGHNALAINMQTNSFSEVPYIRALIDNVTITRIADDDIVCMTNTLAGPDFVVGKKDEEIKLPTDMKVDGYKFQGWYLDSTYTMDATGALFSEDTVIYAKWAKIKLAQDFEDYNYVGYGVGYDMDIEYYNNKVGGYNSKNVYSGTSSIHRLGNVASDKKFTLITDANDKIALGETYKITFYVKLISTKNAEQDICVLPTDSYFYPGASDTDMAVPAVSLTDLYPGVWYKITTVVSLYSPYLAVKTPGLSDIYFDNFTMELVSSDTTISDDEKVVPLGKVPAKTEEETPDEELPEENLPEEELPENNNSTEEQAPQDNNSTSNNEGGKDFPWLMVVICVVAGLGVIAILAIVLVAVLAKKRKA